MDVTAEGTEIEFAFELWVKVASSVAEEELESSITAKVADTDVSVEFDPAEQSALVSGTVIVRGHRVVEARSSLERSIAACEGVLATEIMLFDKVGRDLTELPTAQRYAAARSAGKSRLASLMGTALSYCAVCDGTGESNGDYCNCIVGDERRRVGPPPGE